MPDAAQQIRLEHLLVIAADARVTPLELLRRSPTHTTAAGLLGALQRLGAIRALGVGNLDLTGIPPSRIAVLSRYAAAAWAASIARMPSDRRVATLLAWARAFEARAQDDALDVFDAVVSTLFARVERAGEQGRLRTLHDLDAAALVLRDATRMLRDETIPVEGLRALAEEQLGGAVMDAAMVTVGELTRPDDDHYYGDVLGRYSMVRQFLPTLLKTITFDGTTSSAAVRGATDYLRKIEGEKKPDLLDAPLEAVAPAWRPLVVTTQPTYAISRRAYSFAVLEQLQRWSFLATRRGHLPAPGGALPRPEPPRARSGRPAPQARPWDLPPGPSPRAGAVPPDGPCPGPSRLLRAPDHARTGRRAHRPPRAAALGRLSPARSEPPPPADRTLASAARVAARRPATAAMPSSACAAGGSAATRWRTPCAMSHGTAALAGPRPCARRPCAQLDQEEGHPTGVLQELLVQVALPVVHASQECVVDLPRLRGHRYAWC